MSDKIQTLRDQLSDKEKIIFDSILKSFPATDPEIAFDKAMQGGVNFQFISK